MVRILPLLFLLACNGGDDKATDADTDTDTDGDTDTDADADFFSDGDTWLEGYDGTFITPFEDWAGIDVGIAMGTSQGPVIQDLSEADPTIVVKEGFGSQVWRVLPIDGEGDFPWQLVTVGPGGVWVTSVEEGQREFGFGQIFGGDNALDIVELPDTVPAFATADFGLGRVDKFRYGEFGFEPGDYGDLPDVTALWPIDATTVYAATEPSQTDPGEFYELTLSSTGGTATKLADIGIGPRDILCEPNYCLVSCVISGEVWFYDRTGRRVEPYKWADKAGATGIGRDRALEGQRGLATAARYLFIGSEVEPASVAEVDESGERLAFTQYLIENESNAFDGLIDNESGLAIGGVNTGNLMRVQASEFGTFDN